MSGVPLFLAANPPTDLVQTLISILQVAAFLAAPMGIRYLCARYKFFDAIGTVVLGYLIGIALSNFHYLGIELRPGDLGEFKEISKTTFGLAIMIALPMMLFATDFKSWLKYASSSVLAFVLSCICITTVGALAIKLYGHTMPEGWKVACMLVGSFTGGTPNFMSIAVALNTREDIMIIANAAELLSSVLYLMFILKFGRAVIGRFLPPFKINPKDEADEKEFEAEPVRWRTAIRAILLTLCIVGASLGIWFSVKPILSESGMSEKVLNEMLLPTVIILITTFSLGLSFVPAVHNLKNVDQVGEYFILVFGVSFGVLVDVNSLDFSNYHYFVLAFIILISTILSYYFLCYLFKIDIDTAIIVSCATIFSPPFIPMITKTMGNKKMLLSGMTTGIAGYAMGNYIGLALAYFLRP